MTLRIEGQAEMVKCPTCGGRGSVVLEDTYGVRSCQWIKNGRVPCPVCKGKRVVVGSKSDGCDVQ